MPSLLLHPEAPASKDFLPITGTDYVELYVGNARQSAYFYRAAFGMALVAWAGPETGLHDRSSYVLQQGEIRLVLTTPLRPDGGIADHIRRHGDGVRDIAVTVDDAKLAWRETTRRGARSVHECHDLRDEYGKVRVASIAAYGDTIHSFVERGAYYGPFLPGYEPAGDDSVSKSVGLSQVDHIACNVGWNEMRRWVDYYRDVLGFSEFRGQDQNERRRRAPRVVVGGGGRIRLPINEIERGDENLGIARYLEFYHGPGVQHIALATPNILETVGKMRRQGVEFLGAPAGYYRRLAARSESIQEPLEEIERLGILVDLDRDGYLLQALTRPVEDRPTLFFEIIQRRGNQGFGHAGDEQERRNAGDRKYHE